MNAKDLLLQHENYRLREKRLESEILWTREKILSLDLIPCRLTSQMKDLLSSLEEKLRIYEEDLFRSSQERQKIVDLISEIPGVEGEVLTRRYVDGMIWEEICESTLYSWSNVHKIHNKGLQMIQDLLDQGTLFDT